MSWTRAGTDMLSGHYTKNHRQLKVNKWSALKTYIHVTLYQADLSLTAWRRWWNKNTNGEFCSLNSLKCVSFITVFTDCSIIFYVVPLSELVENTQFCRTALGDPSQFMFLHQLVSEDAYLGEGYWEKRQLHGETTLEGTTGIIVSDSHGMDSSFVSLFWSWTVH